jgi:acetyl-CoA carboxylase biotin carboxyl carrier protein
MPEPHRPVDRTVEQRQVDHAGLARLSDALVPALVTKLNASGLGELEVREGDWRIRLRRPSGTASGTRRADRPRLGSHGPTPAPIAAPSSSATPSSAAVEAPSGPERTAAISPAVGVFRPTSAVGARVRAGDRVAVVDMLGIPQDVVAPIDGAVVAVLPQAGDAVEYGEEVVLVEAEPDLAATTGGNLDGEA